MERTRRNRSEVAVGLYAPEDHLGLPQGRLAWRETLGVDARPSIKHHQDIRQGRGVSAHGYQLLRRRFDLASQVVEGVETFHVQQNLQAAGSHRLDSAHLDAPED